MATSRRILWPSIEDGKHYICGYCGGEFGRPVVRRESQGECFGFPAWEEVRCCPWCGATGYMEVVTEGG